MSLVSLDIESFKKCLLSIHYIGGINWDFRFKDANKIQFGIRRSQLFKMQGQACVRDTIHNICWGAEANKFLNSAWALRKASFRFPLQNDRVLKSTIT